jgi:WD40 repeat protein
VTAFRFSRDRRAAKIAASMSGHPTDPQLPTPSHAQAEADTVADSEAAAARAGELLAELPTVARDHYEPLHELARGGIGKISVARDRRLDRLIAIKELRKVTHYAELRFAREIRISARLQHPSIVPVHEAGLWPDGQPFLAMKLVTGKSLEEAIGLAGTREARMLLLRHVTDVADAVAYAHSEGIVHRDLKPANVLVGPFGETVVIDWGLAKDLRAPDEPELPAPASESPGRHYKTTDGVVLGTPSFMPPEQAAAGAVDERADVYALGALLYHVLSGQAPYDDARGANVLAKVLAAPPTPLRALEPDLPRDLLAIVEKAMARDAADRYPTARELAAELERYVSGGLVAAHRYSLGERSGRFVRRHRAAVSIGALAVMLLAALGVFSFLRIARERDAAESARRRAEESALAEGRMRSEAEQRLDEAILEAARAALSHDPTLAIARLKQLSRPLAGAPTVAADAAERGIARHLLRGHEDRVEALAYSADGKLLASSSRDGRVRVWDRSEERSHLLSGHDDRVVALAFAPRMGTLATGGYDGRVLLWDARSGAQKALLEGAAPLRALAFDDSGEHLASVGEDGVRLWQIGAGDARDVRRFEVAADRPLFALFAGATLITGSHDGALVLWAPAGSERRLEGHEGEIRDAALSPDERRIATAGEDGTVRIWSLGGGDTVVLEGHEGSVEAVAFTPDGAVVSGGLDGTVRLWSGGQAELLVDHDERVADLAVSPDGRTIASASWDRSLGLWDRDTGSASRRLGHRDVVAALAFSPDSRELASASWDQDVRIWPLAHDGRSALRGHRVGVKTLAFDPQGRQLVSGGHDDAVKLWDVDSGALIRTFEGHSDHVFRVRVSPDGRRIASSSDDKTVRLWSVEGDEHRSFEGHRADVEEIAFSDDGRYLASAGEDGLVGLWEVASGRGTMLAAHEGAVTGVAFAPQAVVLASSSRDGTLRLWDAPSGRSTKVLRGHRGEVTGLAFDRGGSLLSVGSDDSLRAWSPADGASRVLATSLRGAWQLVVAPDDRTIAVASSHALLWLCPRSGGTCRALRGHAASVNALAFSPDGRLLASASGDGTVRIWDVATGESRALRGHGAPIFDVAFGPHGKHIASASADTSLRLWPVVAPPSPEELPAWLGAASTHVTGDPRE